MLVVDFQEVVEPVDVKGTERALVLGIGLRGQVVQSWRVTRPVFLRSATPKKRMPYWSRLICCLPTVSTIVCCFNRPLATYDSSAPLLPLPPRPAHDLRQPPHAPPQPLERRHPVPRPAAAVHHVDTTARPILAEEAAAEDRAAARAVLVFGGGGRTADRRPIALQTDGPAARRRAGAGEVAAGEGWHLACQRAGA